MLCQLARQVPWSQQKHTLFTCESKFCQLNKATMWSERAHPIQSVPTTNNCTTVYTICSFPLPKWPHHLCFQHSKVLNIKFPAPYLVINENWNISTETDCIYTEREREGRVLNHSKLLFLQLCVNNQIRPVVGCGETLQIKVSCRNHQISSKSNVWCKQASLLTSTNYPWHGGH